MKSFFSLVKFSHTIFALPFALVGAFIGFLQQTNFQWIILFYILGCMITARNAAMAFNRYIDRKYDATNPRTRSREIPAGVISPWSALSFVIINSLIFVVFTWQINQWCFWLSPVALGVILGYSYTKRITWLCHFILGLGLGLAPVGAFMAVTGFLSGNIILLGFVVLLWVSGFDIIYALQDVDFDRNQQLHSIPAYFGSKTALLISRGLHLFCVIGLGVFMYMSEFGWLSWLATGAFASLLAYQHYLVGNGDLSRVDVAFFITNGVGSVLFGSLVIVDILV